MLLTPSSGLACISQPSVPKSYHYTRTKYQTWLHGKCEVHLQASHEDGSHESRTSDPLQDRSSKAVALLCELSC